MLGKLIIVYHNILITYYIISCAVSQTIIDDYDLESKFSFPVLTYRWLGWLLIVISLL